MEAVNLMTWIFDTLLGLGLLILAGWTLSCQGLYKAIVVFVAFGLLFALVWVRVNAPDIALAEAAIGAGITGALLLSTLTRLSAASEHRAVSLRDKAVAAEPVHGLVPALLLFPAVAGLGLMMWWLPDHAPGLSREVAANIEASGVENPVTAVLLNFRAYDTLLELMVMLMALLGVWSLEGSAIHRVSGPPGPVLDTLVRVLPAIMILVAAYLLWTGSHAPGGAFQAGSILGAAGVLLLVVNRQLPGPWVGWPLRAALVAGPGFFVAIAMTTLLTHDKMLQYPVPWSVTLILLLEAVATLSIGITLAALFYGAQPLKQNGDKSHGGTS